MGTHRQFTARVLLASLCYSIIFALAFSPALRLHAEQLTTNQANTNQANTDQQSLVLNGSAVHTDLQLDYYYAALFSQTPAAKPVELLAHNNLRMELTILVDEWSKRRFNQYWNQSVAINNLDEDYDNHSDELVEFSQLLKGQLIRGDRLVFEKTAGKGTRVSINGVTLMKSKSDQLFSLFANVWIGPRPPSSVFKSSILGIESIITPALMTSYQSLSATGKRKDEIKGWSKPTSKKRVTTAPKPKPTPVKTAATAAPVIATSTAAVTAAISEPGELSKATVVANTPVTSSATTGPEAATSTNKSVEIIADDAPATSVASTEAIEPANKTAIDTSVAASPETTSKILSQTADQSTPEIKTESVKAIENTEQLASTTLNKSAQAAITSEPETTASTKDAADDLTAEASLDTASDATSDETSDATADTTDMLNVYRSNLLALTYQKIVYPNSAIKRNREGKVVLKVVVNRKGEVQESSYHEESKYSSLNKAASKALAKSAPFPSVPESIGGEQFEFLVPINFQLAE